MEGPCLAMPTGSFAAVDAVHGALDSFKNTCYLLQFQLLLQ